MTSTCLNHYCMAKLVCKNSKFKCKFITNSNSNLSSRCARHQLDDSILISKLSWSELVCVCDPVPTFYPLSYEGEYHITVCHLTTGRVWPFGIQRQFFMLISLCPHKQQNNLFNWIRFRWYTTGLWRYTTIINLETTYLIELEVLLYSS